MNWLSKKQKGNTQTTPTPIDIRTFDPTLMRDIEDFGLDSRVVGFLQHLQWIQHQYRESDVLAPLSKCLRGSAFAWFKDQTFTIIRDLGKGLARAFPTTSLEPIAQPPTLRPPPQHYSGAECFAQFSLMSRLLEQMRQETACSKAICKYCEPSRISFTSIPLIIMFKNLPQYPHPKDLESPRPYTRIPIQPGGEVDSAYCAGFACSAWLQLPTYKISASSATSLADILARIIRLYLDFWCLWKRGNEQAIFQITEFHVLSGNFKQS